MRPSLTCISRMALQSLGKGAIREKGEVRCGQPPGRQGRPRGVRPDTGLAMKQMRLLIGTLLALLGGAAVALPAQAGDNNGDFMVRVLATGVLPDTSAGPISINGGPGFPADSYKVSDELIPALTLSYFVNKNWALELFCCFAKPNIDGKGTLAAAGFRNVGNTWIFPPAVTLQYHFDPMHGFKPYAGVGFQYINFFDTSSNDLGGTMHIDDAVGFTLQAGVDMELGSGWYLNADVKKTWLSTSWTINNSVAGTVSGKFDLDPWIVSAGVGYRFNIEDIFGGRSAPVALK
jgi:outer membrane protein